MLAVVLGFGLFGLAELLCVLLGWGRMSTQDDPFVGFSAVHPLFVRVGVANELSTAPARRRFFPEQSFAAHKPAGTFRIFCLGGSTVQGNPYSIDTAFTSWLRLSLEAAEPERRWEVINCGGISYASYRLANILAECLAYEPDLFILCTGHNEFLEDRTYATIKERPPWLSRTLEIVSQLRTFRLMRRAWMQLSGKSDVQHAANHPILKDEVDAWLDYEGGLKVYHRDPVWRAGVIAHFESNLRRMATMAHEAGAPIILVTPTSNLRDCPPFKSQHRDALSASEQAQTDALTSEALALVNSNPTQATGLLERSAQLDDQYALTFFGLGRARDALGQPDRAREAYVRARELDVCPLRILAPMEEAIERVARETKSPWINWQGMVAARSPGGIPGDDWLLDHVHPSIEGHQLLAAALVGEMAGQSWLHPQVGWEDRRDQAYARHLAQLPANYFEEGQRALAGLRAWTQGRASGPPIEYWLMGHRDAQRSAGNSTSQEPR